jgi:hypothetical protein
VQIAKVCKKIAAPGYFEAGTEDGANLRLSWSWQKIPITIVASMPRMNRAMRMRATLFL